MYLGSHRTLNSETHTSTLLPMLCSCVPWFLLIYCSNWLNYPAMVRSYLPFLIEFTLARLDSISCCRTIPISPTQQLVLFLLFPLAAQDASAVMWRTIGETLQKFNALYLPKQPHMPTGCSLDKHADTSTSRPRSPARSLAGKVSGYVILPSHIIIFTFLSAYYSLHANVDRARVKILVASAACLKASSSMVLIDIALLLLCLCPNVGQLLKRILKFSDWHFTMQDEAHRVLRQCTILFTLLHTILWWILSAIEASHGGHNIITYLRVNLLTSTGWTGHALLLLVSLLCVRTFSFGTASAIFEAWGLSVTVTFIVLCAAHGSYSRAGLHESMPMSNVAWTLSLCGLLIYLIETMLAIQASKFTSVFEIIRHPSNVFELHLEKQGLKPCMRQACSALSVFNLLAHSQ